MCTGHVRRARAAIPRLAAVALVALLHGCHRAPRQGQPSAASTQASPSAAQSAAASSAAAATAPPSEVPPASRDCAELFAPWGDNRAWSGTRTQQNELLYQVLECVHGLGGAELQRLRALFGASEYIGQGNPQVSKHPVTVKQCLDALRVRGDDFRSPDFERICGANYMAPLYDPEREKPADAKVCIDRFEFPNVPCAYPVTWVRANEAVEICQLMGKRLCDAHEWEGACQGQLLAPDYEWDTIKNMEPKEAAEFQRAVHNSKVEKGKRWAYGDAYRTGVCATSTTRSPDCGVGWSNCGSNTFPAGFFPDCKSPLGVYDQHGNAAEHMNLPLKPTQSAQSPTGEYGYTEMKGSWFVFDQIHAHFDHCRWRAPFWHGTRVLNPQSHRNYHLGFRCCKTVR